MSVARVIELRRRRRTAIAILGAADLAIREVNTQGMTLRDRIAAARTRIDAGSLQDVTAGRLSRMLAEHGLRHGGPPDRLLAVTTTSDDPGATRLLLELLEEHPSLLGHDPPAVHELPIDGSPVDYGNVMVAVAAGLDEQLDLSDDHTLFHAGGTPQLALATLLVTSIAVGSAERPLEVIGATEDAGGGTILASAARLQQAAARWATGDIELEALRDALRRRDAQLASTLARRVPRLSPHAVRAIDLAARLQGRLCHPDDDQRGTPLRDQVGEVLADLRAKPGTALADELDGLGAALSTPPLARRAVARLAGDETASAAAAQDWTRAAFHGWHLVESFDEAAAGSVRQAAVRCLKSLKKARNKLMHGGKVKKPGQLTIPELFAEMEDKLGPLVAMEHGEARGAEQLWRSAVRLARGAPAEEADVVGELCRRGLRAVPVSPGAPVGAGKGTVERVLIAFPVADGDAELIVAAIDDAFDIGEGAGTEIVLVGTDQPAGKATWEQRARDTADLARSCARGLAGMLPSARVAVETVETDLRGAAAVGERCEEIVAAHRPAPGGLTIVADARGPKVLRIPTVLAAATAAAGDGTALAVVTNFEAADPAVLDLTTLLEALAGVAGTRALLRELREHGRTEAELAALRRIAGPRPGAEVGWLIELADAARRGASVGIPPEVAAAPDLGEVVELVRRLNALSTANRVAAASAATVDRLARAGGVDASFLFVAALTSLSDALKQELPPRVANSRRVLAHMTPLRRDLDEREHRWDPARRLSLLAELWKWLGDEAAQTPGSAWLRSTGGMPLPDPVTAALDALADRLRPTLAACAAASLHPAPGEGLVP